MPQPEICHDAEGPTKVFLSHSTKDKAFVEKLAAAITGAGLEPWLCELDIDNHENFVAKIEQGLVACDVALLVWSPDAAKSTWTTEEWTAILARQVKEQRIRLGIVMLRECELPQLLRTKNYISARTDEQAALRETIHWLKRREMAQRLSGLKAPIYLPDYRPQDFVGRTSYLELLRNELTSEPTVFLLYGEPGSGKSTLALQFAFESQKDFDAVIFQTCGQRSLDAITAELVEHLPIDVQSQPPERQRDAAKEWLRERQSLLVLDDVWSPEIRHLEPGPACSLLYTSRLESLPFVASTRSAKVEMFTETECEELFHATLESVFGADEVTEYRGLLLRFARQVEMLPIAVAVGANLLRVKAAARLDRSVLRLKPETMTDGVNDVPGLFRKAIDAQPAREQQLLAACSMCVQEGFWLPLAAQIAELDEDDADEAASTLVYSSLLRVVDRDRQRFQLHALLRNQVRAQQSQDGLRKLHERHAAALEQLFKDTNARWKDCRECVEETISASRFLWEQGESDRAGQLGYLASSSGRRVGEPETALRIMRQDETFWIRRKDREAKKAIQVSYGDQANILYAWERLDEALALHKKEEAICLELGNNDGLQASYGNQALILKDWGRLDEALALLKKKEAICLELGNKDGLQSSYGNQGMILRRLGRLEEALALHKKKEAICLELGNKDGMQRSYGNQALILQDWGQLDEALTLLKASEAICLELGTKDSLAINCGNQANILRARGRPQEALALHKKEEALCLELGNKDGLQICCGNQALILQDLGRFEEALALHQKQGMICQELSNQVGLSRSYGNRALILRKLGRLDEALAMHRKQEAICLHLDNKSRLADCYWNWGLVARAQGDRQTERQKLEQALAIFTQLKTPGERDAVQADLNEIVSG